jgi:hypothetical protein
MMVMLIAVGMIYIGMREGFLEYLAYPFLLLFIGYFLLIIVHNYRHPNQKMEVFTFIPYELREEDEGMQHFTFKAMRKVYIFYYYALPGAIMLAAFLNDSIPYFTIYLLMSLGVAQYLIYWLEIRKAFIEEE